MKVESILSEKICREDMICIVEGSDTPEVLLLQPVEKENLDALVAEGNAIFQQVKSSFILVGIAVESWNNDLSPWESEPVFGKESFGGKADLFLKKIEHLLSKLRVQYQLGTTIPVILGGYSLAGLFSLWSCYQSYSFYAVAAVSPSVWYPGWMEYAKTHAPNVKKVYLSLGDREEKTKNKKMATVGEHIRRMSSLLEASERIEGCILEWNKGNHFQNVTERTTRGFAWIINECKFHKQND